MFPRRVLLCLVFLCSAILASSAAPVHFNGGSAELDGPWQFHIGDNPAWAAPEFDDSGWEKLSPDRPWGGQGHRNAEGFGWYRYHVTLGAAQTGPDRLAALFPDVEDAYEVYWNGRLVGSEGTVPPHPNWRAVRLPRQFDLGTGESGVLAIRVWKGPFVSYDTGVQGGLRGTPVLGDPASVSAQLDRQLYRGLRGSQLSKILLPVYVLVSLLGLLLWWRDRSVPVGLCLAGLAAEAPLLYWSSFTSFLTQGAISTVIDGVADVSMYFLLAWLLGLREDPRIYRLTRILACTELFLSVIDAPVSFNFLGRNPWPWQFADLVISVGMGLVGVLPFVLIAFAVRRRQRLDASRWAVAIFAFLSQSSLMLGWMFLQGSRFTHWTLGQRLQAPLFTIGGNAVDFPTFTRVLLIFALGWATYRYSEESRRDRERIEQELRAARAVQQVLVPQTIPQIEGFKVSSVYLPAGHVGGDFFQILPVGEGGVLAVIGDVSGKGMPAAMTVSLLVGAVRALAGFTSSPAALLSGLNRHMMGRSEGGFTTCLVVRADRDGSLTVGNAGHLAPYLNGRELVVDNGLPLGISADAAYTETVLHLSGVEQLTLLTDGVVEARSSSGELFGFERTASIARETAEEMAQTAKGFGQDDDITVLTLSRVAGDRNVANGFINGAQAFSGSPA
jgi:hypothetical protein